ncbi:MAG: hypothetical protein CMH60_05480 [Myxococcales bacterium]|nr:hypothetical protein [Myxococcales bacterium]
MIVKAKTPLQEQQKSLSENAKQDFRIKSLCHLIQSNLRHGNVLDFGCGNGTFVRHCHANDIPVLGIDHDEFVIQSTQAAFSKEGIATDLVRQATLTTIVGENLYADNVVSMDCLEHIENDHEAFTQLATLLKPQGQLILTVPAIPFLFGKRDVALGHYRRYNKQQLISLAQNAGLTDIKLRYWNMLGVVPTFVLERLMQRPVNDSFRYKENFRSKVIRTFLRNWFMYIENACPAPLGLTLILSAKRS